MNSPVIKDDLPRPFLLIILMISIFIITGGSLLYKSQKNKVISEKQNELAAISSLKAGEILSWRNEHIRDAKILSSIIPRNKLVFNFLTRDKAPDLEQELLQRMKIFIENYDYHSILLIDISGTIILSYPPLDTTVKNSIIGSSFESLSNTDITLSDLHYSNDLPGIIHVDVQIPLFSEEKNEKNKIGTILLRINPEKFLFPLIQSWPTPSNTSETYLVRPEKDSVLFLNELRHLKNTALHFRLPYKDDLPATAAATGHEGVFEGIDYRGIPVISYMMKIPDSPWAMVAKVDKKEIYSPLGELVIAISIGTLLLIFSISSLIIYIWRNQRIRYLKELNSTKDKFFSIVSHDLKSPFTGIYGIANLMVEDLDRNNFNQVREYAGIILNSTQNAMDLLKNLSEWSGINSNKLAFNPKETDIISIINEVIEIMQAPAIQKSITITKDTPSQLQVYADKEMISSVFRNLISNAIKFTHTGGNVHISVRKKANKVAVKVIDTGVGMKEETIEKLFLIGENMSTPGTRREHGTGLGLILVKEFISLHGGEIHVRSEVGKCSSFMVDLPLR